MVAETVTLEAGSAQAEKRDRIFKADRELGCVVITAGGGGPSRRSWCATCCRRGRRGSW